MLPKDLNYCNLRHERKNINKEATFGMRLTETNELRRKFPGSIPVSVEKAPFSLLKRLPKCKVIIPSNTQLFALISLIRAKVSNSKCNQNIIQSLILMSSEGHILNPEDIVSTVYDNYKNDDGFLYVCYCSRTEIDDDLACRFSQIKSEFRSLHECLTTVKQKELDIIKLDNYNSAILVDLTNENGNQSVCETKEELPLPESFNNKEDAINALKRLSEFISLDNTFGSNVTQLFQSIIQLLQEYDDTVNLEDLKHQIEGMCLFEISEQINQGMHYLTAIKDASKTNDDSASRLDSMLLYIENWNKNETIDLKIQSENVDKNMDTMRSILNAQKEKENVDIAKGYDTLRGLKERIDTMKDIALQKMKSLVFAIQEISVLLKETSDSIDFFNKQSSEFIKVKKQHEDLIFQFQRTIFELSENKNKIQNSQLAFDYTFNTVNKTALKLKYEFQDRKELLEKIESDVLHLVGALSKEQYTMYSKLATNVEQFIFEKEKSLTLLTSKKDSIVEEHGDEIRCIKQQILAVSSMLHDNRQYLIKLYGRKNALKDTLRFISNSCKNCPSLKVLDPSTFEMFSEVDAKNEIGIELNPENQTNQVFVEKEEMAVLTTLLNQRDDEIRSLKDKLSETQTQFTSLFNLYQSAAKALPFFPKDDSSNVARTAVTAMTIVNAAFSTSSLSKYEAPLKCEIPSNVNASTSTDDCLLGILTDCDKDPINTMNASTSVDEPFDDDITLDSFFFDANNDNNDQFGNMPIKKSIGLQCSSECISSTTNSIRSTHSSIKSLDDIPTNTDDEFEEIFASMRSTSTSP